MRRWPKRLAIAGGVGLGVLILAAAIPIASVELSCTRGAVGSAPYRPLVDDPNYRRAEGDSYMTYPEWYIVHAYTDLAAVTRQSSESGFDYLQSTRVFWTSLCHATETAGGIGPVTFAQRTTDYIIGVSFSLEMGVQGLWERTIGAATTWLRGDTRTPEDRFNQRFLDDYAAFLQQTPWYEYPFASTLKQFWSETPWSWASPVRSIERRVALSLEYGVKALYAIPIGALAGASPADRTIETVVADLKPGMADVVTIRDLGSGRTLVRTPRYEVFSTILRAWSTNGTHVVEIAGNDRILVTAIVPDTLKFDVPGATEIFTIPIQSQPGQHRIGLDASVPRITEVIAAIEGQGAKFEHAYDY